MQPCLRVTLWVFLLFGYLQAAPLKSVTSKQEEIAQEKCFHFNWADLGFGYLEGIKCDENVTLASPTNVQKQWYGAAMETFRKGLEHVSANCTDEDDRAGDTLEALELGPKAAFSERQWEMKNFKDFVSDLKTFIEQLESQC